MRVLGDSRPEKESRREGPDDNDIWQYQQLGRTVRACLPAPKVDVKIEKIVEEAAPSQKFKTEQTLEEVYQFVAEGSKTLHRSVDAEAMKAKVVDMCFTKLLQCEVWAFYKTSKKH